MSDLKTRFDRMWSGQDSTTSPDHHPFAHLDVIEELADGVGFYKAFVNLCVVKTDDGSVLIDTGSHVPMFHEAGHQRVRTWSDQRINTAIYTHGHTDHAYGLPPFLAEADAKGWAHPHIVGHTQVGPRMERYVETQGYNSIINERQFGVPVSWPTEYLLPTQTYETSLKLEVGGVALELNHARGETDDHTWVFLPHSKVLYTGDLFIWASPNAGNPQKVQRYCKEWAQALRRMAACAPEILMPGHGLPIFGADNVQTALNDTARYLETIYEQTLGMINDGATIYDIVHGLKLPSDLTEKPFLQPVYDEPDFIARNIYRCLAGWYTGVPSELKPAPVNQQAAEIASLAGGVDKLVDRAAALADSGDVRMACHLMDWAVEAEPDNKGAHQRRAQVYAQRAELEPSTMSKGIFQAAVRTSQGQS